MPLGERIIQPSHLVFPPQPVTLGAANVLFGVQQQLASLVRHADDIFCDITEECQKVFDRSDNIGRKLQAIEKHVRDLDAKTVHIPIGDLSKFSRFDNHHTAKHGFDCDIFTDESCPQCVKDQYNLCDRSPSRILSGADLYRKDGLCSSRLFQLWPVILNEHKIKTPDLRLPRKLQGVFTFEKRYKKLPERLRSSLVNEYFYPEKKECSTDIAEDPNYRDFSEFVQVDISGTGFHVMESFRKALVSIEYEDLKARKKQRRTISGIPEYIWHEIELFEQKRRNTSGSDRLKAYYFEDDLVEPEIPRDEEMVKYLEEVDARIEERREDERFLKEPKLMKFLPCRRSKSLPRCMKLGGVRAALDKKSLPGDSFIPNGSCLTLSSFGSSGSGRSRSTRRGSIGKTIKALVRSASGNRLEKSVKTVKSRPKSLDRDVLDFDDHELCSKLVKMPSMPNCVLNKSNSTIGSTKVGPGSYYSFESESNTLPRRNVKKASYLWEGISKDWTTSVKLREISKRRSVCTDRLSSSGHWSGSNSNRHSLDSDNVKTSQCSLGQDSGRDSPLLGASRCGTESVDYHADDDSTLSGETDSAHKNSQDTISEFKNLLIRAEGREEQTSSSSETLTSLTLLTKKNIMALDLMMSSLKKEPASFDDGESSVYSVDQEGFYTSFHNDSGLKKSTTTMVHKDDMSSSTDSYICTYDHNVGDVIQNSEKHTEIDTIELNKADPPIPSLCSMSDSRNLSTRKEGQQADKIISSISISRQDSSVSDTDHEINRLLTKTQTSPTAIPSLGPLFIDEELATCRNKSWITANLTNNLFLKDDSFCGDVGILVNENGEKARSSIQMADDAPAGKGALFQLPENDSYQSKTIPRGSHSRNRNSSNTNSWPRIRNRKKDSDTASHAGILKSSKKALHDQKQPKSLNFSPFVNLFNPGAPHAVQVPIPSPSPSEVLREEKENKSVMLNMTKNDSYRLKMPLTKESKIKENVEVPLKYQPTIIVKPGSRVASMEGKEVSVEQLRPQNLNMPSNKMFYARGSEVRKTPDLFPADAPNTYTVNSPIKGTTQSFNISSQCDTDNCNLQREGGSLFRQHSGSSYSLESSDSLTLSNSLTCVTMTSPCSSPNLSNLDAPMMATPNGSFESLSDKSNITEESNLSKTIHQTNTFSLSDSSTFMKPRSGNTNILNHSKTVVIAANKFSPPSATQFEQENKSFQTFTDYITRPKSSTPHALSLTFSEGNQSHIADQHSSSVSVNHQRKSPPFSCFREDRDTASSRERDKTLFMQGENISVGDRDKTPIRENDGASTRETDGICTSSSITRECNIETGARLMPDVGVTSSKSVTCSPHSRSIPSCISNDTNSRFEQKRTQNYRQNKESLPDAGVIVKSQNTPDTAAICGDGNSSYRTDSYRVAMVNPNNARNESNRVSLHGSSSLPSLKQHGVREPVQVANKTNMDMPLVKGRKSEPFMNSEASAIVDPTDFNRTDSYRVAVRSTQGVVPPGIPAERNSSYRVAVDIVGPVIPDFRLEGLMTGNSGIPSTGRDTRRRGITNVDQLKYSSSTSTNTSKLDMSSVVRRRPKPEVDPISEISYRDAKRGSNRSGKNNSKRHSTSSTYIQFDPIFELGEEICVSTESLRTESNSMMKTVSEMPVTGYQFSLEKPKINALNGAKLSSEKSVSKLLGSIKSTFKSISGTTSKPNGEPDIQNKWRFSVI